MELVNKLFKLCETLQYSQGFYGRLLENLYNTDDDALIALNEQMREQLGDNPSDLDIILWLEC